MLLSAGASLLYGNVRYAYNHLLGMRLQLLEHLLFLGPGSGGVLVVLLSGVSGTAVSGMVSVVSRVVVFVLKVSKRSAAHKQCE